MGSAAKTSANFSRTSASRTLLPGMASATRRSLRGAVQTKRGCATACDACAVTISPSPSRRRDRGSAASARTRRVCARPCSP